MVVDLRQDEQLKIYPQISLCGSKNSAVDIAGKFF
jgi:hypothetical protein